MNRLKIAGVVTVLLAGLAAPGWGAPGDSVLVSRADGLDGAAGDAASRASVASADGRFVAFESYAANFAAVRAGHRHLFLRDVRDGRTELVGIGPDGAPVESPAVGSVSEDGRYVSFADGAYDGEGGEWTGRCYVRDRQAATTLAVPLSEICQAPRLSGDGRLLVFATASGKVDVRDLDAGRTERVSDAGFGPTLSADGRMVAFSGTDGQVYVHERVNGTTSLVSRASGASGAPGDHASSRATISANGRSVVFLSSATNLGGGGTTTTQVYERDLVEHETVLVSRADGVAGAPADADSTCDCRSWGPSVSADGRLVAFHSHASNLPGGSDEWRDFVRDTEAGTTRLGEGSDVLAAGGAFAIYSDGDPAQLRRRALALAPADPPAVSIADASVSEGAYGITTTARLTVTLAHAAARRVGVDYATADGTAHAGADYRAVAGRLLFAPGQTSAQIAIEVNGNDSFDGDRRLSVVLSAPSHAVLGRASAVVAIAEDEPSPAGGGGGSLPPDSGKPAAACDTPVVAGFARLRGCFKTEGTVSIATGVVSFNGMVIQPDDAGTTIRVAPAPNGGYALDSSGPVTLLAGDVALLHERLDLTLPTGAGRETIAAGTLAPPAGSNVYGLRWVGGIALSLGRDGSAEQRGYVDLAFSSVLGVDVEAHLKTDPEHGLLRNEIQASKDKFLLGALEVQRLSLRLDGTNQTWAAEAKVVLPTPSKTTLAAGIAFDREGFKSAFGEVDNLKLPIQPGVDLQRIKFAIAVRPLKLGGGIGVSAGPTVGNAPAIRVDGNFSYTFSDPGALHVDGTLRLGELPLASAFIDYLTSGNLTFGGQIGVGLPNLAAEDPTGEPAYLEGHIDGWVDGGRAFNVEAGVQARVLGVRLGVDLLASTKGLAACGDLQFFRGGFGYAWDTKKLTLMGPFVCDVGPWRQEHAGAAASGAKTIELGEGASVLRLVGTSPVTLRGPGGRQLTTPAPGEPPVLNDEFVALQDSRTDTTYVAIHHGRGTWSISPGAHEVSVAAVLAPVRVRAGVRGHGAVRRLTWRLGARAGQRVIFSEIGPRTHRVLGTTTAARGTLRFRPAAGPGGRRRIVALVEQDGRPRDQLRVAVYRAPRPAALGAPRRLSVARSHGGLVIRWRAARGPVAQYLVEARVPGGPELSRLVRGHSATLPAARATVTVRAVSRAAQRGPAARRTVR